MTSERTPNRGFLKGFPQDTPGNVTFRTNGKCRPDHSVLWIIGFYHKTGNAINTLLVRDIYGRKYNTTGYLPALRGLKAPGDVNVLVETAAKARILMAPKLIVRSPQQWEEMVGLAREGLHALGITSVRAVLWYRDPLDLIVSAYNYHLKANETWLDSVESTHVDTVYSLCNRDHHRFRKSLKGVGVSAVNEMEKARVMPDKDFCETLDGFARGRNMSNVSYRTLLRAFPPETALRIQAVQSAPAIYRMEQTYLSFTHRANSSHRVGFVVDLDGLKVRYNESFKEMFEFLGVNNVQACLDIATTYDLSLHPYYESVHVSSLDDDEKVRQREALTSFPWFQRVVEPMRKSFYCRDPRTVAAHPVLRRCDEEPGMPGTTEVTKPSL